MHWRKSMSERSGLGGLSTDAPATLGSYAPSDSILVPADLPLPRSNLLQAVRDVFFLGSAFLFVGATGCGLAFALFVLFFVRL